jgi:hypothetical protein
MFQREKFGTSINRFYAIAFPILLFSIFVTAPAAAIKNGYQCSTGEPYNRADADALCTEHTGRKNVCAPGPVLARSLPRDGAWYCMDTKYNCALPGGEGSFRQKPGQESDGQYGHPITWVDGYIYTCRLQDGVNAYFR